MRRRTAGIVVVAIGVILTATVFSTRLFGASAAFERVSTAARATNTHAAYTALRGDVAALQAISDEFAARGTTTLATAFHQTPAQVASTFAGQFPATAKALLELPSITTNLNTVVTTLDDEVARFARADAIPTNGTPSTRVPWFILITGLLGIAIGGALLSQMRGAGMAAALLGAVLIATPILTSLPQKSSAADTMNDHLKPIYTASSIATLQSSVQTLGAMGTELQTKLVPVLGAALHATPAQVNVFLGANFPVLSAALPSFGTGLQALKSGTDVLATTAIDFRTASRPPLAAIAWIVLAGGAMIFLFALWSLAEPQTVAVGEMPRERHLHLLHRRRHAA